MQSEKSPSLKAEKLRKEYDKIEKKFIITQKEAEIINFFRELKCNYCNRLPQTWNKNIKIGKDIYCEICYKRLFGRDKPNE